MVAFPTAAPTAGSTPSIHLHDVHSAHSSYNASITPWYCDRHACVANILNVSCIEALHADSFDAVARDPLGELEAVEDFHQFLLTEGVAENDPGPLDCLPHDNSSMRSVSYPTGSMQFWKTNDGHSERSWNKSLSLQRPTAREISKWNRKRKKQLGDHSREVRKAIRAFLEPGLYMSFAGKKEVSTLNELGACHMLPCDAAQNRF